MNNDFSYLIGQKYTFEDGSVIEIFQVKMREVNNENVPVITYHIYQGRSLPRKLLMPIKEFANSFGHLFDINNEHIDSKDT